jgi:hypothetical protein
LIKFRVNVTHETVSTLYIVNLFQMKKVVKCYCSRIEGRGMVWHSSLNFICSKGCKQVTSHCCVKKVLLYILLTLILSLCLYADLKTSQKMIIRKRSYMSSNLLWTRLHWIHLLSWLLGLTNLVKVLGPQQYNWNCLCRQCFLISADVRTAVMGSWWYRSLWSGRGFNWG